MIDKNSYRYLPEVGTAIAFEEPSPPDTLPETNTSVGIVIVWLTLAKVISKIILPTLVVAGKLVKSKVIDALVVIVW